jgi:AraC-like DNA-binding protein
MIITKSAARRLQYETIPLDAKVSFAVLEFRPRYYKFVWHYHPELELALIMKGRGLRFVGDSIQEFREGDLCLLGPNLPHTWFSPKIPKTHENSMVIQFLPECLGDKFLAIPEARPIVDLLARSTRGLQIQGKTRQQVTEILLQMRKQTPGSLQHLNGFVTILTLLGESRELKPITVANYEPLLSEHANRKVNQVLNLIHSHMDEIPTQEQMAKTLRLSPQAFSRFFKRCLSKTYVEYVNELRVGRVCRALIESDASVTEIAYEAGFNNISNFNEQFRKFKRMTPREYRRLATVGDRDDGTYAY